MKCPIAALAALACAITVTFAQSSPVPITVNPRDYGAACDGRSLGLADIVAEGHRTLIFSQFTSLLDRAETRLQRMGVTMARLDGSTPAARRREEVDAFQLGLRRVFLLSLKAGGVGLNLTAASYVIHLDPWWNPAAEDQAIDRAHRIGQDKAVTVYRLVARDTIEERVLALHAEKRELAAAVLDGSGSTAALDADTILELLAEGARTAREGVSLDADEG